MPQNPRVFPLSCQSEDDYVQEGISLRDWLAGQALVGLLSDARHITKNQSYAETAAHAYKQSDAMLAER